MALRRVAMASVSGIRASAPWFRGRGGVCGGMVACSTQSAVWRFAARVTFRVRPSRWDWRWVRSSISGRGSASAPWRVVRVSVSAFVQARSAMGRRSSRRSRAWRSWA
jgi:hypothetical protein